LDQLTTQNLGGMNPFFLLKLKGKPFAMLATTITGVNYTVVGSPANAAIV